MCVINVTFSISWPVITDKDSIKFHWSCSRIWYLVIVFYYPFYRNGQAGFLEVDGQGAVGSILPSILKAQLNTENGLYIGNSLYLYIFIYIHIYWATILLTKHHKPVMIRLMLFLQETKYYFTIFFNLLSFDQTGADTFFKCLSVDYIAPIQNRLYRIPVKRYIRADVKLVSIKNCARFPK